MDTHSITILLAVHHAMFQDYLKSHLRKTHTIHVIENEVNYSSIIDSIQRTKPEIVILDIDMFDKNGIELLQIMTSEYPDTKIMIMTGNSQYEVVLNAIKSGASGYILNDCDFSELNKAIMDVHRGEIPVTPRLGGHIIKECLKNYSPPDPSPISELTELQIKIAKLTASGKTIKEIISTIHIGKDAVQSQRKKIYKKLNVRNAVELTLIAIRAGLISP